MYDNSPLDRLIKQIGAGKNWYDNDRAARFDYSANVANEVRSWVVSPAGSLSSPGFYPAGSLLKNIAIDEDGNKHEEFKDRADNIVLTVAYNGNETCKTHYVYDNKGLLRLVIPPAVGDKTSLSNDDIKKWCYSYSYDSQGRMIEKRLPGVEAEYYVYDAKNRVVLSQNGNQRLSNKWCYYLYDLYNRIIESGESVITSALISLRTTVGNSLDYIPSSKTPLVYTYFDNYLFTGVQTFVPSKDISGYVDLDGIDNGYYDFVSGQPTGSKVKVLDDTGTKWITTTIYYDCRQRTIQVSKSLYPSGTGVTSYRYDFTGNVLEEKEWQTVGNVETLIDKNYIYDDRGRLTSEKLKVNNDPEITLAGFTYDGLGRLLTKTYHGGIETQTYTYNVRDWMTGISGSKFKEELRYETALPGLDTTRYFNGIISFMSWQNGDETKQVYAYRYDGLGRLTRATYCNLSATNTISNKGSNDVSSITYDKNGNILSLQRKKNGTLVDNLTYGYNGNLLRNVLDASTSVSPGGYPHTTGTLADQKYVHDENGNLTKDLNNKITAVSYNFINLPKQVTKDGQNVHYVYSAAGEKLQVSYGSSTVLNYNGPIVREGSSLKYIITDEGRYVMNGTSGVAEYHLTDHLGNVRVALNASGSVVQSNSYYPFGSLLSQSGSSDNRYHFNSKEQQEISGWLDYGWRMYDAVIGRWGGVDPMAETNLSFSPFNYCSNNAINRIDPDGADSWLFNIATGELSWWNSQGGNEFQMIHVVSPASNGGLLHLGTSILEGSMSKYFFGSYSGGYAFSTRDYWRDLNFNLRGYKGYQYDMDDLRMRYKVLNSGSHHLKVALFSMENRGWAEPLTSRNYWNTYGHTLGMLNLMSTYIPAGVGLSAGAQKASGGGKASGRFFNSNRLQYSHQEIPTHGNSLKSTRPTWGYKLYRNDGTFLKNGITSERIPENRYTRTFMSDKHMQKFKFPNRRAAYNWEYQENLINRGPLNKIMH